MKCSTCCNPECRGEWGTGCYCCHFTHSRGFPRLGDEKREGYVILCAQQPEYAPLYLASIYSDKTLVDWVSDPESAIVFADRESAAQVRLPTVRVVQLADALAAKPKPLGRVAAEAFDRAREDLYGAKLPATQVLGEKKWEAVAQSVVAEHERRKR